MLKQNCSRKATEAAAVEAASLADEHDAANHRACFAAQHCKSSSLLCCPALRNNLPHSALYNASYAGLKDHNYYFHVITRIALILAECGNRWRRQF